jgi:hypothetical protein
MLYYYGNEDDALELTHQLVNGCNAELELKQSVASVIKLVGEIQTNPSSSISSLMVHPDPQEFMKNFKLDVKDFASKVANLYNYYHDNPFYIDVSPDIIFVFASKIKHQMERIKQSFEAKLKMLEMLRDVALPKMIVDVVNQPTIALFSDPIKFEENVNEFRTKLDELILQHQYILGLHVAPSRMLRTISHVPSTVSSTLRLAPPNAAIRDLRRMLNPFSVDPSDIARLKSHGAFKKMLATRLFRLFSDNHNATRKSFEQKLIGWHKEEPKETNK